MRNPIDRLVDGVRQYAQRNSGKPGWAFVVDALSDEHLVAMLDGCTDAEEALELVDARVRNVLVRR